jgi:hypothetical protein
MPLELGQGSGDFRETSSRVQLYHMGIRNALGIATPDAFTQANPPIVVAAANVSTTLAGITSLGVLGATVAFTRPDAGNGFIGGPVQVGAAYVAPQKPLGLFLNDAAGNAFENTPATASGRIPYCSGQCVVGVTIWETQIQVGASTALTYAAGDNLYASVNGLLTNRIEDAYQYNVAAQNDPDFVTLMGVVKVAPDANNSLMVIDMRV